MIGRAKVWVKNHWPRMRLRTVLFACFFVVAALPGVAAMFLRVYENTLVRQTEAELVAQGAALAAAATVLWPGPASAPPFFKAAEPPTIDLSTTPILAERPVPAGPARMPQPAATQAWMRLKPVVARTQATTLAEIILLDASGRVLDGPTAGRMLAGLQEVDTARKGQSATVLRRNAAYRPIYAFEWLSRAAAIRVHHARPILIGRQVVGVLLLSRSARALFRGLYEDRGKILLGIAAILTMLIGLSGVISRGVTRPIELLGLATRAVASGRGSVPPAPPTAALEIQGLYADFATMAAAIERRSRYLRDFAHAVSHEFKTPLAGIRGAIELLADYPDMAPEDRRRFLANADADAGRLTLLVTRLLDLARADMAKPEREQINPIPVIEGVASAWRAPDFAVSLLLPTRLPPVAASAATLERVLGTLLENARQAGAREVRIEAVAADALELLVSDDGRGITESDRERLFEPFFTTRRAEGGSGLGLAIAVSLLDATGSSLSLTTGERTCFKVRLPWA